MSKNESQNARFNAQKNEWLELIPLEEYDLPAFPVNALPESLKDFVNAVAESLQVPFDLPAMLSLAAVSCVVGGRCNVLGKPDWTEQLNIYVVVVMPSATRKSAVFKLMTEQIQICERELRESLKPEIEKCKSEYRILDNRRKKLEQEVSKGKGGDLELDQVNREIANFQWIREPRLIASDVTVEVVSRLLSENNGRLGIFSAEGGLFATFAGRYSDNKPVNDVFLKAHVGDLIVVDRIGRESECIEHPELTIGLCIQPTILENLGHKRLLQDSGLLARFLFCIPDSKLGTGTFDTPAIPEIYKSQYNQIIKCLFENVYKSENVFTLSLAPEAVDKFRTYYEEIEKLLKDDGELKSILSWAGKLRGSVLRIAGLIELVKFTEQFIDFMSEDEFKIPKISLETIESAIKIGWYLTPHAKAAFSQLQMDKDIIIAKRMVKYIRKESKEIISKRELFEHTKGAVDVAVVEDIEPAIETLEKHAYLRPQLQNQNEVKRGRKSELWEINPVLLGI